MPLRNSRGAVSLLLISTLGLALGACAGGDSGSMQAASEAARPANDGQPLIDITRFRPTPRGTYVPFHVTDADTRPLREALQAGTLLEDTPVLLVDTAAGPLALLPDQMAYHHIAQGRAGGKDWMATF